MQTVTVGDLAIPSLGFGTWQLEPSDARRMVEAALEIGYRHVDTAWIYKNEAAVGEAIRASGVPRDEVFLTTKVWVDFFKDGELQRAAEGSVERLGVGPVDLLLLHWPKPEPSIEETVRALNDVKSRGLAKAIGLSNFPSAEWRRAQAASEAPLATNQVEHHPYLPVRALKATAAELGSSLTAWSPLAQGKIANDPVLKRIAKAHGKTPGQVTLRWLVQQGVIAIPRTAKESRARENFEIWDFALTDEEVRVIDALGSAEGRLGDWLDPAFRWDPE